MQLIFYSAPLYLQIEGNHNGDSCFIGVSPRDLTSLEDLWRDYIVEDLREFVKETVLPEDFRGEVDVNIDSEEYKRCCKRLRPRGNYFHVHIKVKKLNFFFNYDFIKSNLL